MSVHVSHIVCEYGHPLSGSVWDVIGGHNRAMNEEELWDLFVWFFHSQDQEPYCPLCHSRNFHVRTTCTPHATLIGASHELVDPVLESMFQQMAMQASRN
jgi:hypothetical protein